MQKSYESTIYEQKKALQSWQSAIAKLGVTPDTETSEEVWELMLLFGDILASTSAATEEDIYKTAYDIARRALDGTDIQTVHRIYRDEPLRAMLANTELHGDSALRVARFASLISDAIAEANTDRLKKLIRHQRVERLSDELKVAKGIQQHLLPRRLPRISGFDFAGRLIPAAEVGGDYWSVKHYPEDGIVTMKLADISGHGIAAATLVAAVKFISGGYYRSAKTAAEVIEYTNHVLVKETPSEILVTMVYGWLKPEERQIVLVNAGHEPVFLCKKDRCVDIPPTGPLMGLSEAKYDEVTVDFEPSDVLFISSDGLTEAGIREPFGVARLRELVVANRDKRAEEIADTVISAVIEHAGTPHDDMSLLLIKCTSE